MANAYNVIITKPAENDLEAILTYVLEYSSLQSALKIRRYILDAINELSKMPSSHGLVREVIPYTALQYRQIVVKKKYRVIFLIEEGTLDVYVVRILHVNRGPETIQSALL
jgi:plasmid stabilization system protein ParE